MNTTITELIPTNGRKSFYGKARVLDDGERRYLLSYNTVVASAGRDGRVRRHSDYRSRTTDAHVLSFLSQFGADVRDGKSFRSLPVEPRPAVLLRI